MKIYGYTDNNLTPLSMGETFFILSDEELKCFESFIDMVIERRKKNKSQNIKAGFKEFNNLLNSNQPDIIICNDD